MSDISALLARANTIKNETSEGANTATRVGGLLAEMVTAIGSNEPTKHTITQVYSTDELQKVFSIASGESVIMRYSCYVSGRSWTDELYYTNTGYPCEGSFYTHYYQDFVERRKVATGDCVCIKTKNASAAPSLVMTIEVIYASGDITWYDGVTTDKTYTSVINSKVASTIDLSAATNLTTNASGTIYNDSQTVVSSLSNNTTYTMNASASNGLFTIPARSNYVGTKIFCYGDGTATLNSVEYEYTSGQTLELNDGVVVVGSNVKDYYDKDETDEKLKEITDSIATVYRYKGSCAFTSLPTSGQNVGDTWNITDDFTLDGVAYKAGTNVSWTGSQWDALEGDSSNKEDKANKVTSIDSLSTNTQYPSALCMYKELANKANEAGVVHLIGNESINGTKTIKGAINLSTASDTAVNGILDGTHVGTDLSDGSTYIPNAGTIKKYVDSCITDITITIN